MMRNTIPAITNQRSGQRPTAKRHGRLIDIINHLPIRRALSGAHAHAFRRLKDALFKKCWPPHSWRTRRSGVRYNRQTQVAKDRGSTSAESERASVSLWSLHDLVGVLAITAERQAVLAYEYRYRLRKTTYNLLSDSVLEGEVPSQAARRTLAEQAGYLAHQLTPLGRMVSFPETVAGTIHLFLARDLHPASRPRDRHRSVELVLMDIADTLKRTLRGEFEDAALQLALLSAVQQRLM
jgi:ADP-ribose diphosphatase